MSLPLCSFLFILTFCCIPSSAQGSDSPFSNLTDSQQRKALIPWDWTVQPTNSSKLSACPDASHTLGMFAAVNLVGTVGSLIIGNRYVVHAFTCGFCARRNSRSWPRGVLFQICIHVGSAFLNSYLSSKVLGYTNAPVAELALLFLARPRLTWIPLTALISWEPYRNTAMATIVTEVLLQFFGAYTMGRTAHFAAVNGYYLVNHHNFPHGSDAYLMYCGAMIFLVFMSSGFTGIFYATQAYYQSDDNHSGPKISRGWISWLIFSSLSINWLGSWLFWAGFIKLAGDLYCLPNLIVIGIIFALFSILSTFVGSGFA